MRPLILPKDKFLKSRGYTKSSGCWIKDGECYTTLEAVMIEVEALLVRIDVLEFTLNKVLNKRAKGTASESRRLPY